MLPIRRILAFAILLVFLITSRDVLLSLFSYHGTASPCTGIVQSPLDLSVYNASTQVETTIPGSEPVRSGSCGATAPEAASDPGISPADPPHRFADLPYPPLLDRLGKALPTRRALEARSQACHPPHRPVGPPTRPCCTTSVLWAPRLPAVLPCRPSALPCRAASRPVDPPRRPCWTA